MNALNKMIAALAVGATGIIPIATSANAHDRGFGHVHRHGPVVKCHQYNNFCNSGQWRVQRHGSNDGANVAGAAVLGIIGGADGPTAIFLASKLAPDLLGAIAVAAYSYMALVPIIQPPIMKLFTTEEERNIEMPQLRHVSKAEKVIFPLLVLVLIAMFLPAAAPLVGMFCLGNLMRESGVVDRLSKTAQNELINITTIFLGLAVGSKLAADQFLTVETLGILALGAVAFGIGTGSGVLMAKAMNKFSKTPINPLVGAAGVSAVPMAARVVNKVGLEANPHNFLLMHAMGPNVAGVLGSAVAAGILLAMVG